MAESIPVVYDGDNYASYSKTNPDKFISPPEPEETGGEVGSVETGETLNIDAVDSSVLSSSLFKFLNNNGIGRGGGILGGINVGDLLNGFGVGGSIIYLLESYVWTT